MTMKMSIEVMLKTVDVSYLINLLNFYYRPTRVTENGTRVTKLSGCSLLENSGRDMLFL